MAFFQKNGGGNKYFNKDIPPKCAYCSFGNRTKEGNKILCEKRGLVEIEDSCPKFVYSPLKRVPVKQLDKPGNFGDLDDLDE